MAGSAHPDFADVEGTVHLFPLPLRCRPEARDGAGHVGHGVREGREALPPHGQGQPHQRPETQAHHLPEVLPGKVRNLPAPPPRRSIWKLPKVRSSGSPLSGVVGDVFAAYWKYRACDIL